ncbi:hypothetical protein [Paenibacillus marinisediminis]
MNLNVGHCERCKKVFQITYSNYCPDCVVFIRTELERCSAYLRAHPDSTLVELSEATEVPVKKLIYYINEGKLYVYDYPNLTYPCYFCEIEIKRGYLCTECAYKFKMEVTDLYIKEGYEVDQVTHQIKQAPRAFPRKDDTFTVQGRKRN